MSVGWKSRTPGSDFVVIGDLVDGKGATFWRKDGVWKVDDERKFTLGNLVAELDPLEDEEAKALASEARTSLSL